MALDPQDAREEDDDMSAEDIGFLLTTQQKYSVLESDTQDRLSRYRIYNSFVNGDQWIRVKSRAPQGRNQDTVNLCAPTVEKMSALLMAEIPRVTVPRESELSPLFDVKSLGEDVVKKLQQKQLENNLENGLPEEFNRSEVIEKILRRVMFEDNSFEIDLQAGADNGSEFGDTIYYIFWDKEEKKVVMENVFPGHVRLGFSSNDFKKIEFAFVEKVTSLTEIKRKYDFDATAEGLEDSTWDPEQFLQVPSAKVKYYWDKETFAVIINGRLALGPVKHTYKRVPLFLIPNRLDTKQPWGRADLENVVPIQEEYNGAISDEADIVKIYSDPKVLVFNPGSTKLKHFTASGAKVIPVSKDAEVRPFQFQGNIFPTQQRIQRIKNDFHIVSNLPEIAFGSSQGSIVTGVALTAQFSPVLQIIRKKISIWNVVMKDMMSFTLDLLEQYGGKEETTGIPYKTLIDGWRKTDFQWGTKTPRDDSIYIANELNKMNGRVQSRTTTMTNLGIQSPQDELDIIAFEETNPTLSPKFAMEQQMAETKTGSGDEPEMMQTAESENQRMAAGEQVQVFGRNMKEHMIHLELHGNYVKNNEVPEELLPLFDEHMQGHEIAIAGNEGRGGVRSGSGRPEDPEGLKRNAETAREPEPQEPLPQ